MNGPVAIATNTLGARSETFVHRHIEHLFGGRTVVVCRRTEGDSVSQKPTLVIGEQEKSLPLRGVRLIHAVWNQVRWGGIPMPTRETDNMIAQFLKEQRVSCILAEFGPLGCIVRRAANLAKVPLYVYFRGQDASSLLARPGVLEAYRRLMPDAAGVFTVSRFLVDNLRARGLSHVNTEILPSGVNTDLFVPGPKNPQQLLYVGRFVPKKSPELVVRAFASVAGRHSVRLEMIGEGPLLETCKSLARSLGVADRIDFSGAQPHEYVQRQMATAIILLQHSATDARGDTEGLPSVIQEAMSAGAVVVSTRHAGIPEAIESGVNGMLVDEGDLDAFANVIDGLLGDPHQAETLAIQARHDAIERFDCRRLTARLESILLSGSGVLQARAVLPK